MEVDVPVSKTIINQKYFIPYLFVDMSLIKTNHILSQQTMSDEKIVRHIIYNTWIWVHLQWFSLI